MKNLTVFLGSVLLFLFVFSSCSKEATDIVQNENLTPEAILAMHQDEIDEYVTTHEELNIEHSTLEELNKTLIENGMQPYTLEDLGITQEEYSEAQERIKSLQGANILDDRCPQYYSVYFGDCSDDGKLSTWDIVLFTKARLYQDFSQCTQYEYSRFGFISNFWGDDNNPNPSQQDGDTAQKIILGIYPCI